MSEQNKVELVGKQTDVSKTLLETKVTKQDIIDIIYEDSLSLLRDKIRREEKVLKSIENSFKKHCSSLKNTIRKNILSTKTINKNKARVNFGYYFDDLKALLSDKYHSFELHEVELEVKFKLKDIVDDKFVELLNQYESQKKIVDDLQDKLNEVCNKGKFKVEVLKKTLDATKEGQEVLHQINQIKVSLSKDMKLLK